MARKNERPVLTVDALIENEEGKILLIKRGVTPFKGLWCLPGGKVDSGERVEAALEREIVEEVGVRIGIRELLGVYSDPDRDPRGHFVSVVYHATIIGGEPTTTDEADELYWLTSSDEDIEFGFDHAQILQDWWKIKREILSIAPHKSDRKDKSARPDLRRHPVDQIVEQVEDEGSEDRRLVEDEAGRGKRAVKMGERSTSRRTQPIAEPMKGTGTKKTAAAGKAVAKKVSRRG